jgi:DSBA-like thioredoxin domain
MQTRALLRRSDVLGGVRDEIGGSVFHRALDGESHRLSVTLPPAGGAGPRSRVAVRQGDLCPPAPWGTTENGLYVDYQPQGKRLSVTGTPTFFVNGRALVGAQPLDAFTRMIDDEVARASSPRCKSR